MKGGPIDLSEVQDFSISKKAGLSASPLGLGFPSGKGKLDDMLTKLMKKNNYVSAFTAHHYRILHQSMKLTLLYLVFIANSSRRLAIGSKGKAEKKA